MTITRRLPALNRGQLTLLSFLSVTIFLIALTAVSSFGSYFDPATLFPTSALTSLGYSGQAPSAARMKVVFGGTTVNSADFLVRDITHFYTLASLWGLADFRIFIVLGMSSDSSLSILQTFRDSDPLHFDFLLTDEVSNSRAETIAIARNHIIDRIHTHHPDYQYFFNADLDDKFPDRAVPNARILRDFLDRSDWDVLSFNREDYYDIWALRTELYPYNCWSDTPGADHGAHVHEAQTYYHELLEGKEPDEWVPVESAFGGAALYRVSKTVDSFYVGKDAEGYEDCEHVAFHRDMHRKNGAKVFISPLKLGGW